jgi:hypothetical protein
MINKDKWIDTLPKTNIKFNEEANQIDHYRWVNTISKKNTYNDVRKYTLITVLFVCGLLFVSVIKNGTRNLEKEINNLSASVNVIKFNLNQAILDHEVITSPENISRLAKEYLDTDFVSYKKSQIRQLDEDTETIINTNKKNNNLTTKIKLGITKKIKKKKTEIRKLQELYSNPRSIPGEIKTHVANKIKEKKIELKNLYTSPEGTVNLERARKWAVVQVAKIVLGIPIVPGK